MSTESAEAESEGEVVAGGGDGWDVIIASALGKPTTCKVWRNDVLVFDGIDSAAVLEVGGGEDRVLTATTPPPCAAHREVQHRDGKPPWCDTCGWNHGRPAIPAARIAHGGQS